MSTPIQLVAEIGDQTIRVGTCHPGQARILVKKGHAAWKEGQLALHLRPIHLQVAENTQRWVGEESHQVSNAEVDRRLNWLRAIMKSVVESDTHGSDLERIVGPQDEDPLAQTKHRIRVIEMTKGRDAHRLTHADYLKEGVPWPTPPGLTEAEAAEWFNEDEEPGEMSLAELTEVWHRGVGESGDWFYTALGQQDSRKAPIRVAEPGPMREPDEADGVILDVQAAVVGEGTFDAKFVKTDFEQWREDAQELPVRFAINCKRSEHAHWPNPTDIGPVPQQCPSCGLGTDDNGDGDCAVCGPKKVSR